MLTPQEQKAKRQWRIKVIGRIVGTILLWLLIVTGFTLVLM